MSHLEFDLYAILSKNYSNLWLAIISHLMMASEVVALHYQEKDLVMS